MKRRIQFECFTENVVLERIGTSNVFDRSSTHLLFSSGGHCFEHSGGTSQQNQLTAKRTRPRSPTCGLDTRRTVSDIALKHLI